MHARYLRWLGLPAILIVSIGGLAGIPSTRTALLQAAGWWLVVDEALGAADVLVLTVEVEGAGVLEAADLVQRGLASRVAVFADAPDEVDRELVRRGISHEGAAERSERMLRALGVASVERIPRFATGTTDEAQILPVWCEERQFRSVIVISSSDHSRRLRRALDRAMKGRSTKVAVRYSRYSEFDPDRWWRTRAGLRTGVVEMQKLLLDVVRHPLS